MSIENIDTLSGYFQTNDQPTQAQFLNLIETSVLHLPVSYFVFQPYNASVSTTNVTYYLSDDGTGAGNPLTATLAATNADDCRKTDGSTAASITVDSHAFKLSLSGITNYIVFLKYKGNLQGGNSLRDISCSVADGSSDVTVALIGNSSNMNIVGVNMCSFGVLPEGDYTIRISVTGGDTTILEDQEIHIVILGLQ